jgi:hypothetical protein
MSVSPIFSDTVFYYPAALTTAGATDALSVAVQDVVAATTFGVQVKVASIGTNVVVRVEGSLDGTNFFNLDAADKTLTSNGTYFYNYSDRPLKQIRGNLISISAGTPTVTFVISAK